ncbi:unnamed protein product [Adineta steineri]|uniref:Beta-lactamase-related domain-containing protein n=1 Tax=Adineta steineri TaxID=433720 RepID=A0A819J3E5_9BILA|nr:unnamed protein product [Adineta steineri]CAF3926036.1 unnamed protein product [Adineta steineri]
MLRLLLLSVVVVLVRYDSANTCPSRSFIKQSLINAHIPGAAIIVVNTTDILYQEAFGYQSLFPMKMMDVNKSIFVLASISKTFIAVAVMQLVELNRLDLDTDINQYLSSPNQRIYHPQYPSHAITLRQLLSHSASIGINEETDLTFMQHEDDAFMQMSLADACFTYLSHNTSNWLPKPPGTVTLYSNVGTSLAGLVIERVTQMPYELYVKENILKPLDINVKKAGFRLSDIEDREELVKQYAFNTSYLKAWNQALPQLNITKNPSLDWLYIPFYSMSIYPAGLLRMSAQSLSKFLRMFMNNGSSLLHPRSIDEMRKVVNGVVPYDNSNPPILSFGLIWNWQKLRNRQRYIGHGGSMPGATHSMLINEQGTIGIIVLTNADVSLDNDVSIRTRGKIEDIQMSLFSCFEN